MNTTLLLGLIALAQFNPSAARDAFKLQARSIRVLDREPMHFAPARGTYREIILARDANSTTNLDAYGSSPNATCPYRSTDGATGFSIGWSVQLPDGARIVSVSFHLRLGEDPSRLWALVKRTPKAGGPEEWVGSKTFVPAWNAIPSFGSGGEASYPGALPCADTETDLAPELDPGLSGQVIDNARYSYALELQSDYGGNSGTRVYWAEVVYEVP